MKNQSGILKTMITNLELYRGVMSGKRRLPGGSDHFSLQTNRQTLHHNIYIIIVTIFILITNLILRQANCASPLGGESPSSAPTKGENSHTTNNYPSMNTIIIFNLQKMNSLGTCHKVWNRSCLIPYKQGSLRPHAGAGLWYWRTQENWNIENIKSRKTIKERNQNWVN